MFRAQTKDGQEVKGWLRYCYYKHEWQIQIIVETTKNSVFKTTYIIKNYDIIKLKLILLHFLKKYNLRGLIL